MSEQLHPHATLVVPASRIQQLHPGLGRRLGLAALLLLLGPPILGLVALALNRLVGFDMAWGFMDAWLLAVWAAPLLGLASVVASSISLPRPSAGWLVLDPEGLAIEQETNERWITRAFIVDGLLLPMGEETAVELHLRGGSVLRAIVAREELAESLLAQLELGPERRRVAVALGTPNRSLLWGCAGIPLSSFVWSIVLAGVQALIEMPSGALAALWVLCICVSPLVLARLAWRGELVVGAEGVLVRRALNQRLVRYETLYKVSADQEAIHLFFEGPKGLEGIVLGASDAAKASGIAERIRKAAAAFDGERAAAPLGELLEARGRSLAAWRASLASLVQPKDAYRRTALSEEALSEVLSDPRASAEQRMGAALALSVAEVPEARARIRIAADTCADEATREALAELADGELDERTLQRVLESGLPE